MLKNTQQRVLVAAIALILGMLAYPPFQVIGENGWVSNMGYHWIFDPPTRRVSGARVTATVNVGMLLAQWIAVIIVVAITSYLIRGLQVEKDLNDDVGKTAPASSNAPDERSIHTWMHPGSGAYQERVERPSGPRGVGGWLTFLIMLMMLIGPFWAYIRINADLLVAEALFPRLEAAARWQLYKAFAWTTFFAAAAISVYGGHRLLIKTDPSAVRHAKIALWATGPVGVLVASLVLFSVFGKNAVDPGNLLGVLLGSTIFTSAWTLYLTFSKRVRNTYGERVINPEKDEDPAF